MVLKLNKMCSSTGLYTFYNLINWNIYKYSVLIQIKSVFILDSFLRQFIKEQHDVTFRMGQACVSPKAISVCPLILLTNIPGAKLWNGMGCACAWSVKLCSGNTRKYSWLRQHTVSQIPDFVIQFLNAVISAAVLWPWGRLTSHTNGYLESPVVRW